MTPVIVVVPCVVRWASCHFDSSLRFMIHMACGRSRRSGGERASSCKPLPPIPKALAQARPVRPSAVPGLPFNLSSWGSGLVLRVSRHRGNLSYLSSSRRRSSSASRLRASGALRRKRLPMIISRIIATSHIVMHDDAFAISFAIYQYTPPVPTSTEAPHRHVPLRHDRSTY